jgi:hypothetical protein
MLFWRFSNYHSISFIHFFIQNVLNVLEVKALQNNFCFGEALSSRVSSTTRESQV